MSNGLAHRSVRSRPASFVGTCVALAFAAAIVSACGTLLQTGVTARVEPVRYADVPVVVAADQKARITVGHGEDEAEVAVPLPDRALVDADLADRIARQPGVASALADPSVPLQAVPTDPASPTERAEPTEADVPVEQADPAEPVGSTGRAEVADSAVPAVLTTQAEQAERAGAAVRTVPDAPAEGAELGGLGELVGRDWSATAIAAPGADPLVAGRAPAGGDEVVLEGTTARAAGLDIGDAVRLTAPTGTATYRISGLATSGLAPDRSGAATAWLGDGTAGRLAGHPGRADAIAVFPRPGVSTDDLAAQVRHAVGDRAQVHTGHGRGEVEEPGLAEARELLTAIGGSFGGVATATAVFVVMGTVSLAIGQRSREIALLRAVGATPRQIRRTVATETLLVAPVAGAIGAVPGVLLARWWFDQLVARGAIPRDVELSVGWIPFVSAIGSGLLAATIAGYLAARRPAKASPSQALGEAAVERRRLGVVRVLAGAVALVGGVVLAGVASKMAGDDAAMTALGIVFLFMLGVALLGPIVAWLAAAVLGLPLRAAASAPAELAAASTRAEARRLASAITPIVLVVAFCGTMVFLQTTMRRAAERNVDEGIVADHIVGTAGAGLPAGLDRDAAAVPGVDAAVGVLETGLIYRADGELTEVSALGVTGGRPGDLERVLALDVEAGSLDGLVSDPDADLAADPDVVAVDALVADAAHVSVGDRIDLRLGDGVRARPRVVATYRRGLGLGEVVLPRQVVAGHVAAPYDTRLLVADAPGADRATVDRALGRLDAPGLVVVDRAGYAAQLSEDLELNAWANNVMAAVLGGFAAVAAVNTLVMVVLDRRREVSLLRLAGTTRRQILRMLRWEALVVTVAGITIGAAIAGATLLPLARGTTGGTPYIAPAPALAMAGATVLLGLLATGMPARALLRLPAASAGGSRE
jgi:putative ABC transport system permease protein